MKALLLLAIVALPAVGQGTKQTLPDRQSAITNVDVIRMVKAGLSDTTILLVIQHSKAKFDTSPQQLVRLKTEGVSPKILDAMLQASSGVVTAVSDKGDISGKAAAITNNGDLKPARLANVYLLYSYTAGQYTPEHPAPRGWTTPAFVYVEKYTEILSDKTHGSTELGPCWDVLDKRLAVAWAIKWATESDAEHARIETADEDGQFKFKDIPSGTWDLIVDGRAGLNEAFWKGTVTVEPGKEVSVKLLSPEASCLAQ